MNVSKFVEVIGSEFYAGVPDSQLKPLCNYLMEKYDVNPKHHVIAANEGNCVGIAAGYYLATKKIPVVYMQNSGEGNVINPLASLLNEKVYGIPIVFVIGWRGQPGVHDEPQHVYQGEITTKLMELMGVPYVILDSEMTDHSFENEFKLLKTNLLKGKSIAIIVKKGALQYVEKCSYANEYGVKREEIIKHIVRVTKDDPIISTTGKASRELFEIREKEKQGHEKDFLTVGSMGHSSSIAMGIALQKESTKLWCIDGDGALLMHMGAMAVIGANKIENMVHIVINNGAHETVGGMPTVAKEVDLVQIAKGCGYPFVTSVSTIDELDNVLELAKKRTELCFIEVKSAIGSRDDLGRPTTTTKENKDGFMEYLETLN